MSRAPRPHCVDAGVAQPAPELRDRIRRQHDLPAVLAGITGAGHEPLVRCGAEEVAELECPGRQAGLEQAGGLLARIRPLHRDHREVEARLDGHLVSASVLAQPGEVLVAGAGVDDHPVPLVVQVIDDQVIDDAAVLAQHARVERLARLGELGDVVREQPAQIVAHARAAQVHDAHVGNVEHARIAAHRVVLLDLGPVIDRHVPAAEIDDACARGDVDVERVVCAIPLFFSWQPNNKKGGGPRRPAAPLSCDLRDRVPENRRLTPSVGPSRGRSPEPIRRRRSFA